MSHSTMIRNGAIILFGVVSALFLVFFIYMGLCENVAVYSARDSRSYTEVTGYSVEQLPDGDAPAGVHTIYRWTLDAPARGESSLCFYVFHHQVQVFIDGELMYSLTSGGGGQIGDSVSSNWIMVPIYPEDAGKEVTVLLTPLFVSVIGQEPQFLMGSQTSIIMDQLVSNIPHLLISALCIVVGILIIGAQLYFTIRAKVQGWNMIFMGSFSILLGLWQITGVKSSPLIFSGNPMVLGYITIGVLFLCGVPMLLFASTYFHGKKAAFLRILSGIASVAAALVLLLQILGAADFRETLVVSHVMLLVTIGAIAATALIHKKGDDRDRSHGSWKLLLLPAAGIVIDLAVYYASDGSSDLFFATLVALLVYALVTFVLNILDISRKAYTDSRTGLTNKVRWNELMNAGEPVDDATAIMMLDLNGLKQVNDTLGHDAGDMMILSFSRILRRSLPKRSLICRWGGDEFAVMLTDTDREQVDRCLDAIRREVDNYNTFCDDLPIYYAAGCALSADHPGLNRMELLSEADRQMYLNKRKWYSERPPSNAVV